MGGTHVGGPALDDLCSGVQSTLSKSKQTKKKCLYPCRASEARKLLGGEYRQPTGKLGCFSFAELQFFWVQIQMDSDS